MLCKEKSHKSSFVPFFALPFFCEVSIKCNCSKQTNITSFALSNFWTFLGAVTCLPPPLQNFGEFSSVVMFLQPAGLVGLIVCLPSTLPSTVLINSPVAVCGCVLLLLEEFPPDDGPVFLLPAESLYL